MDIVVFALFDFQLTVLDICAGQKQKKAGIDGHDGVFLIHLKNVLFKCSNWKTCTTRLLVYCFSLEYASESEEDFDVSDVSDDEDDSEDVDDTDDVGNNLTLHSRITLLWFNSTVYFCCVLYKPLAILAKRRSAEMSAVATHVFAGDMVKVVTTI